MSHNLHKEFGKIMISYAWDLQNPTHGIWIEKLYLKLVEAGWSVTLDKHSLAKIGRSDVKLWMERAVRNADWIIAVVTEKYIQKCDDRDDGNNLGYEIGQIIHHFIDQGRSDHVICILRHQTIGVDRNPSFLPNALHFDFTDDSQFDTKFSELLDIFTPSNAITQAFRWEDGVQNSARMTGVREWGHSRIDQYHWQANENRSIFNCMDEPKWRITLCHEQGWSVSEPWATRSLGKCAYRVRVALEINKREYASFNFAANALGEQYLPVPLKSNDRLIIDELADRLATILNAGQPYDNLKASAQLDIR